jgi:hypothetical protein
VDIPGPGGMDLLIDQDGASLEIENHGRNPEPSIHVHHESVKKEIS